MFPELAERTFVGDNQCTAAVHYPVVTGIISSKCALCVGWVLLLWWVGSSVVMG